jgi:hypothetical protein
MKFKRPIAAAVGFGLLVPLAACYPHEPDPVKTQSATQWLIGQQQSDGGFETAKFAGFETPDAIFALAETAQTQPFYDTAAARQRVASVSTTSNKTALDNVDALVDRASVPSVAASAQAAKITALVAEPLGINPTDFDPSNNSVAPVNLIARIKQYQQTDGTLAYGAQFNGVLYGAIALAQNGETVSPGLVNQIKVAQRPDGSWNYAGNLDAGTPGDVDTTSLALLALSTTGLTVQDTAVHAGAGYLAAKQDKPGSFAGDPNSTALAAVALSDLRIDVTTSQWRADEGHPIASGSTYSSPYDYLNAQQASDGHIAGPNDKFGLNTFGTSQGIQALSRQWYLDEEHQSVSYSLAFYLMTIGNNAPSDADAAVVSNALGTNPSIAAARVRAANAAVSSESGRKFAANDLFQQAFGRDADASGRAYYADLLTRVDRPSVFIGLLSSAEFTKRNGPSAGNFVDGLYEAVLARPADTAGRDYWVGRINAGVSRASVAKSFVASVEYKVGALNDVYNALLGRNATNAELFYGILSLRDGRIEATIAQVGGSAEYYGEVTAPLPGTTARAEAQARRHRR